MRRESDNYFLSISEAHNFLTEQSFLSFPFVSTGYTVPFDREPEKGLTEDEVEKANMKRRKTVSRVKWGTTSMHLLNRSVCRDPSRLDISVDNLQVVKDCGRPWPGWLPKSLEVIDLLFKIVGHLRHPVNLALSQIS